MNSDHGPDCYACTDPAGAARQIAAKRAELDAEAARGRKHRQQGQEADAAALAALRADDRARHDDLYKQAHYHLGAANAIFSGVQVARAHLARVEAAHPALLQQEGAA